MDYQHIFKTLLHYAQHEIRESHEVPEGFPLSVAHHAGISEDDIDLPCFFERVLVDDFCYHDMQFYTDYLSLYFDGFDENDHAVWSWSLDTAKRNSCECGSDKIFYGEDPGSICLAGCEGWKKSQEELFAPRLINSIFGMVWVDAEGTML